MPIGKYKFMGSPPGPVEIQMSTGMGNFEEDDPKYRVVCNQAHCTLLLRIFVWMSYVASAILLGVVLTGMFSAFISVFFTLLVFMAFVALLSLTFSMHAALVKQNWMYLIPAMIMQAVVCVVDVIVFFVSIFGTIMHVALDEDLTFKDWGFTESIGWKVLVVMTFVSFVHIWIFDILVTCSVFYRDQKDSEKITNTSYYVMAKPTTTTTTTTENGDALGRIYPRLK